MPLDLNQFDMMEHLWSTLDKTPDGLHIRYSAMDVEQLWWMGFVDTRRVSIAEWKAAFEPYRQPDGSFILKREEFLSLDACRYKGEIRIPFDPMKINEGKYTDEGLDELVEGSIAPSCGMTREWLKSFTDTLKKDFRQKDGLILIKRQAKERIRALLDEHPSPLRNLEILLDNMIRDRGQDITKEVEKAEADIATAEAARQVSRFASEPASIAEEKAIELRAIEKSRKAQKEAQLKGVPKVELGKIRRLRKGVRG